MSNSNIFLSVFRPQSFLFFIIFIITTTIYASESSYKVDSVIDLAAATLITNCHELQEIKDAPWPENYVVMNDIDCSMIKKFEPIGTQERPFTGRFEGENYTIYNLTIDQPNNSRVGLFGNVNNSIINNINLKNFNIKVEGQYKYVGSLVGNMDKTNITNSHVQGTIEFKTSSRTSTYVGGFIGSLDTTRIENSSANVKLNIVNLSTEERTRVGGFIGYTWTGRAGGIYDSHAISTIKIEGEAYGVGGFIGEDVLSKIHQNYAITNITAPLADRVGGFAGLVRSSNIMRNYSEGDIIGKKEVGGFIGYLGQKDIIAPPDVTDNYSKVNVTGDIQAGGFIGYVRWGLLGTKNRLSHIRVLNIKNAYVTGRVHGRGAGGLIGYGEGGSSIKVISSYWDQDTTHQPYTWDNRGFGKTTVAMKRKDTYGYWNFSDIWFIDENHDYPRLQWQSN